MPRDMSPKITTRDNGYFEVWTLSCGHKVRVRTEDLQGFFHNVDDGRITHVKRTRERLAVGTCLQCAEIIHAEGGCNCVGECRHAERLLAAEARQD